MKGTSTAFSCSLCMRTMWVAMLRGKGGEGRSSDGSRPKLGLKLVGARSNPATTTAGGRIERHARDGCASLYCHRKSVVSSGSSSMMWTRSKRDMMGLGSMMLDRSGLLLSYLPPTGFAAARMDTRALSVAWMPALAIEMLCCSMLSWIATYGRGEDPSGGRTGLSRFSAATESSKPALCRQGSDWVETSLQRKSPRKERGTERSALTHLVLDVHLVKFVNAADAVVSLRHAGRCVMRGACAQIDSVVQPHRLGRPSGERAQHGVVGMSRLP